MGREAWIREGGLYLASVEHVAATLAIAETIFVDGGRSLLRRDCDCATLISATLNEPDAIPV